MEGARARAPVAEPGGLRHPVAGQARPAGAVQLLQRQAGNAAVARLLAGRTTGVQRLVVNPTAGGSVGDKPATNQREAVMLVLDRLRVLWAIDNKDYDEVRPKVSALGPGDSFTDEDSLKKLNAALTRAEEPTLAPAVAQAQFGFPLVAPVGTGLANLKPDVNTLQGILLTRGLLTEPAFDAERKHLDEDKPRSPATMPATFDGLSQLKRGFLAGTAKVGWSPLIHADEAGPSSVFGNDKLADRTFSYQDFMVFVPSGAVAAKTNNVHVFFGAAGMIGGASHTEHHGLRGAAEGSDKILIGVQGEPGKAFTISSGQITAALESVGRPARIDALTLSAHSRGNAGLAKTLQGRLLPSALIQAITILDGNDFAKKLLAGFKASRIPLSKVTADIVTTGRNKFEGVKALHLDWQGVRSIGYARLIKDAVSLGRVPPLPPGIASKVNAVTLPPRGTLSASPTPPAGRQSVNKFCAANKAALEALRAGEKEVPNVGALSGRETSSPYAFVEWHDLLNLRDSTQPRDTWRSVTPGIYSHHLFVGEIAADLFQ